MKKFVIVVFACIFTSLSANAKTLKGKVIGEISTYYPKETIKIEVTKSVMIKNTEFKKGYVVTGTMTDVKSPDKGQNEASFVFTITDYTDTDGTNHKASEELKTTYTPKSFLDKGFFKDADLSLTPNMPIQVDNSLTNSSTRDYKNVNIKPMSIVNSLLPEEYRADTADIETDYRAALPSDKEDILLLDGDRIKFDFPD